MMGDACETVFKIFCNLFFWGVIICFLILPTSPLWLLLVLIRYVEQIIYEKRYDMTRFPCDDILWMCDTPKNRSIINGIMIIEEHFSINRLRELVQRTMVDAKAPSGLRRYPNASRCITKGFFNYYWIEEEKFDISDHVYEWSDKIFSSKEELVDVINEIGKRPLIHEGKLSPWEHILIHFMDNQVSKSCMLVRSHHSLADGLSSTNYIINHMSDRSSVQVQPIKIPLKFQIFMKMKGFFYSPLMLLKLLLLPRPSHELHCNEVSGKKIRNWSEPISLALLKCIKNKLKVTINDVLVGCLATTLHQHFKEQGKPVPENIMTSFPCDTRYSLEEAESFSNKFAVMFLSIPTESSDALENVHITRKRMNALKQSGDFHGMRTSVRLLNYAFPLWICKPIFSRFTSRSSMVLSNVPGPQKQIMFDGSGVEMMNFWPPQKDQIGISVSLLSYNGIVWVSCACDSALNVDPKEILKRFPQIFQSLASDIGLDGADASY